MKISDGFGISAFNKARKKTGTGSGAFSDMLVSDGEEKTEKAASAAPVSSVTFLNEIEDISPEARKRQALDRGNDILDELEKFRDGLLMGTLSVEAIKRAYEISQRQKLDVEDPKLEFLVNEIEVRAAVELAKLNLL